MLLVAGVMLVYPGKLLDAIGFALVVIVVLMQWLKKERGVEKHAA